MELSKHQAQELALNSQLYRQQALEGKAGVLDLIRQLSYVQIDTISVVERAHHHTIWSRIESYRKEWLDDLLAVDRQIYEHWGHAASYLPMENYRCSLPRMERFPDTSSWERHYYETHRKVMDKVLDRINAEGPLGARDFENTGKQKSTNGWGTGKPEKIALELLLWKGELMVERRDRFQRIYNLRERILPEWVNTSYPSELEMNRHFILRAIEAMGIATANDLRSHFMLKQSKAWTEVLNNLVENNEIAKIQVEKETDRSFILPGALDSLKEYARHPIGLFILSPFDNATILRGRLKRLFAYDYSLECYVPPQKRVYGYWCLPLLYNGQFVGRLDCKANRQSKQMEIISLHWEAGLADKSLPKKQLQEAFDRFAGFNGCTSARVAGL